MDTLLTRLLPRVMFRSTACSPRTTTSLAPSSSRLKAAGKPIPVVTGQDSEVESVKSIVAGEQYMTINKDTRHWWRRPSRWCRSSRRARSPRRSTTPSRTTTVCKVVAAYLLPPVVVTKENAAEAYKDNPDLFPLTQ